MKTINLRFRIALFALLMPFIALQANDQPETETQFTNWLKEYIPAQYPGSSYHPHNGWYQVFIPEFDLTVSWGLVPLKKSPLKEVEGLFENKSIFIAKEAKEEWAKSSKVKHYPGVGYHIAEYNSSAMGNFEVGQITVIQFDGNSKKFVDQMAKAYKNNPEKSETGFVTWLKDYVTATYPAQNVAYHGAWYQYVIPTLNLTATWGTMSVNSMELNELHGLRKDKSIFIENQKSTGWEKDPNVDFIPGVGYNIPKYDAETMGKFEVGKRTVIQFDGENAKKFTESMAKSWQEATKKKEKYRMIMMSDFPPIGVVKEGDDVPNTMKSDPDDMQSMVRFLLYTNEFDIEGLVAAAGTFAMVAHKKNILDVLDRYEKVYDNLKTYDPDYPTADYLRSVTYEGRANNHGLSIKWGCGKQDYTEIIGKGLDSEASNAIIAAADKPDPRPLWISVWGGPREVAQAIWDVKNTRSEEELKAFISKLRVHLIYCQDATHEWLINEFPDLFIIESIKTYQGMFGGHDPISDLAWVNEHIRFNHGPLCDVYPHEGMGCTGVCEGDSPSFLYLVSANRGINDPEDPTQPSWGGQYVRIENTNHYVDGPGITSISKWRNDFQKEFKERADRCIKPKTEASYTKPRVINTTDLGADPDDEQSMVRQLVCANEFDIEGLIVSTGCWKKTQSNTDMLDKILDAYAEVYDNLTVHAEGFPTPEYLKSISVMGQKGYGMSDVGTGKDSPGSDLIIASADKDDPRPVWVMGWGGMNNIAQAIWKVKETLSPEELAKFLSKLRLFDILGQDDAGAWIAKNFPDVFYIRATGVYGWQSPKNGIYYREHIQNHGPLGAVYPDTKWAPEGDTPAFMHVYPNGLNDPEQIDQGGWGGRFSFEKKEGIRSMSEVAKIDPNAEPQFDPYYMYGNTGEGAQAIKRWSKGYDNDFAARMDWSITKKYEDANHHPIAILNGDKTRQVLKTTANPGSMVELSAAGSFDPDGNDLNYSWSFYNEPSSYNGNITIENNTSPLAKIKIPDDAAGKTLHIILEVYDNGTPNLYAYRRLIVNVKPDNHAALKNEDPVSGMPYKPFPDKVVVTRVRHFDNICWKIATAGGTWYFENGETDGKTGFSSAFDQAGNDWIGNDADKGYNKSSSQGGRHEYRGWPNFGEGNFNHPQRKSNSTSKWVDAAGNEIKFDGKLEGNHLIMRSSNQTYELEYHFFPTHAAIKILKADDKYAFLFEGPVGGEQEASIEKDYYVLKDGIHREIKAGGLGFLDPEFGNKFPSPFFYLVDSNPKDNQVLYIGVKDVGPETAGDEGWRQGENMVIFSFGRDDDKRAYTGTDAVCVFGFHEKSSHEKISKFIEERLSKPFELVTK